MRSATWDGVRRGRAAGRLRARSAVLCAAAAVMVAGAYPSGVAHAAFARPFVHELPATEFGTPEDFTEAGGLTLNREQDLILALGEDPNARLQVLGPAPGNEPVESLPIDALTIPRQLAIAQRNGDEYIAGEEELTSEGPVRGSHVERFSQNGALVTRGLEFPPPTFVALDNACATHEPPLTELSFPSCTEFDAGGGDLYVSHGESDPAPPNGDGQPVGIARFDEAGEPAPFGPSSPVEYVSGNEIRGTRTGPGGCQRSAFESHIDAPGAITVDERGDLFAVVGECEPNSPAVVEYDAAGEFVRVFSGLATPGVGGDHDRGGFGGNLTAVAYDASADHLLVSVHEEGAAKLGAVDEFDATTGAFVGQITEASASAHLENPVSLAVDSAGYLYVADRTRGGLDVYGPGKTVPGVRLREASAVTPSSAVVSGEVDPEALSLAECHFEYVTEAAFRATGFTSLASGGESPCEPDASTIPADTSYHAVTGSLSSLNSGTTYEFRLVAATSGPHGGSAATAPLAFTASATPVVLATSATGISATSAALHAEIDPKGAATSYFIELVDAAQFRPGDAEPYEAGVRIPAAPAGIGAGGPDGNAVQEVVQVANGLTSNTIYHVRVVATNAIGTVHGEDTTFATLSAPARGLPDGRAYELLTPTQKESAADMFAAKSLNGEYTNEDSGVPADAGDGFLLQTQSAFGPTPAAFQNTYAFSRVQSGWGFTSLAISGAGVQSIAGRAFDESDLNRVALTDDIGSAPSEAGLRATSLVGLPGGPYQELHADPPIHEPLNQTGEASEIVGASADLSHVVLESTRHDLCPGATNQDAGAHILCEWAGGGLELANVDAEGNPVSRCGALLGQDPRAVAGSTRNAVTNSSVVFTAPDPEVSAGKGCWQAESGVNVNAPQLYLRSSAETVRISKPTEPGVPDPCAQPSVPSTTCQPAAYVGAAADGSRIFFVTRSPLTRDETNGDLELYEYDVATAQLTRISSGETGTAAGEVWIVPAVPSSGSAVYFESFAALAQGATSLPELQVGEDGPVNLYRYDTASRETRLVATVLAQEAPTGDPFRWFGGSGGSPEEGAPVGQRISFYTNPSGEQLVFATSRALTSYDTASTDARCHELPGTQGDPSEHHCVELYRYDARTGLPPVCVSCNPDGEPPVSNALFNRSALLMPSAGPVKAMSADGSYVFFDTADPLVPEDANGTLDVYEWHDGRVSLISSGQDSAPSFFLGSSSAVVDGRAIEAANVFFGTHARLVSQDIDGAGDLYDARIGGGFPAPSIGTAPCEGAGCQNPPAPPSESVPLSLSFSGSGNLLLAPAVASVHPPTRAQKLAAALRACHHKPRRKRARCERVARKRFGKPAAKRSHQSTKAGH